MHFQLMPSFGRIQISVLTHLMIPSLICLALESGLLYFCVCTSSWQIFQWSLVQGAQYSMLLSTMKNSCYDLYNQHKAMKTIYVDYISGCFNV